MELETENSVINSKNSSGEAKLASCGKNPTGQPKNKYPKRHRNTSPAKPSALEKKKNGKGIKNTYVQKKTVRLCNKHQFQKRNRKRKKEEPCLKNTNQTRTRLWSVQRIQRKQNCNCETISSYIDQFIAQQKEQLEKTSSTTNPQH